MTGRRRLAIPAATAILIALAFPLAHLASESGRAYRARPCPEWADRPVTEVPARCADYFHLTTTQNGDQ